MNKAYLLNADVISIRELDSNMAELYQKLEIIDFKSKGEDPLTFEPLDDKATILDVKRFVNQQEGLALESDDEMTGIKIYWFFVLLQDDVKVKDLLDQKEAELELYYSLPQYNCSGAGGPPTGETMVISKKKNFFGKSKIRCLQLQTGRNEVFKIPKKGKFAVARNKIEGTKNSFVVRYYEVEDNWRIEIGVDQVFKVFENGNKKVLPIVESRTETISLETPEREELNVATGVAIFSGLSNVGRIIYDIIQNCT